MATQIPEHVRLLYRVPEVAAMTGLADSYIWRLIQRGELPVVKIGRATRIRIEDLQKFIEERSAGTA
ncbi:MAG TPA: helix-turn-helix domain-containing protein [Chloroflexota bacterium]|nr:helix-turn-helix domain-containing protein [Chloroflexota bacterium]